MARQQKQVTVEAGHVSEPVKSLFDTVAAYLDTADWNYSAFEDKGYFSAGCHIKDGNIRVIIDVYEVKDWQRVIVYSTFPVFVPELRRAAIAESLTRINHRTVYGNLEMDFKDGEIRVRTTVEAASGLGNTMIERVMDSNFGTANRFFAPLLAVAFGNAAPDTVLDMAEKHDAATLQ